MKIEIMPTTFLEIYKPKEVASKYTNSFNDEGMEKSSLNAYLSDWEDFSLWCNQNGRPLMPASPQTVADYLEDRSKNSWVGISGQGRELKEKPPLKWNSLDRKLTAISKTHQYNGFEFSRSDPTIKRTLARIKKDLSKNHTQQIVEKRKSPVLMDDIRKMVGAIPDTLAGKRDRALLLIGFSAALRRSELAKIHKEHLTIQKEGILLLLPWSKTGMREIAIPFGSNFSTCPVRALQEWLEITKIASGPIFRAINRYGQVQLNALSDKAVVLIITRNKHIRETIKAAKEQQASNSSIAIPDFGGHSLRAGFVTQAILNDVPEHAIMTHTGHKKSDTLKKYIREIDRWKNNPASKLGL